jgi:hypothetical protein
VWRVLTWILGGRKQVGSVSGPAPEALVPSASETWLDAELAIQRFTAEQEAGQFVGRGTEFKKTRQALEHAE